MDISAFEGEVCRGAFSLHIEGMFGPGIHLITGMTGSGKTTLAETLIGNISPKFGTIRYNGIKSMMLSMQSAERHVTTPTVSTEIASFGADRKTVLSRADLNGFENRRILSLSRGELKKLILMCILSTHFDLLVLDEPYAGLDCAAKQKISDAISDSCSDICIILTHDLSFLPPVDYLWEIEHNTLTFLGLVPDALHSWKMAPEPVTYLLSHGIVPANIDQKTLMEAACRIRESGQG